MDALDWLKAGPIAHRALHNKAAGWIENSMSAFKAAVEAGYAIECDLQIAADGVPMVFHDESLDRLTAESGPVRERTSAELSTIALKGSRDTIRPLSDHLELVAGRVPLILELKGVEGEDAGLVEGVAEALGGYDGPVAVMSFDHWLCAQFADTLPNIPRGLTAEGGPEAAATHEVAMAAFDLQFVSYDVKALPHSFVDAVRERGLPVITWTVRTDAQVALTYAHADQMTFEGFLPQADLRRETYDG